MTQREIAIRSASGFIDDIYDQMRKQGYPETLQTAIINQIKNQLK